MELLSKQAIVLDSCLRPHSATGPFSAIRKRRRLQSTHHKRKATDDSDQLYREKMRMWKLRVLFASGWKGSEIL